MRYPEAQITLLVASEQLQPVEELRTSPQEIAYITAAAKVADALEENTLLAPIESSVIPLPHQILALLKAVSSDRLRLLLADEVGLGKTIEAGLIIKELKLRGLIRRVLVVAPKGLVSQWAAEMRTHFGEDFRLLLPSDFPAFRRVAGQDNVWKMYDQIICPMDAVKPIDTRRGWSKEQLAEYNRDRFEDLLAANWDLIVIDEAHRLGGMTDQVARFRLGQGLAESAPYLLLLTATPHQGKTDSFHRLVSLLDKTAFPDPSSVSRERLEPYLVRTEKRRAIDAQGNPLFKPRRTQLEPVHWNDRHLLQRQLYEAISEYVRIGYNQAIREKKNYVGFLLILMQRLVTSSTRAIRTTLERRQEMLQAPEEQLSLFPPGFDDEWPDMDGQEQIEMLLRMRTKALRNERAEVQLLLDLAKRTEATTTDAKAEALLDWIYRLQQEESDPDLKVLLFTEFVPSQEMLRDFLSERGFSVACLNGSMDLEARKQVLQAFAGDVRILVSKAGWKLRWSDGTTTPSAVFTLADAQSQPAAVHLTLEEPRIRGIATRVPRFVPGQPIPSIEVTGVPWEIRGYWSLWTVAIRSEGWAKERVLALFLHDDGRVLPPTARHLWTLLLEQTPGPVRYLDGGESTRVFAEVTTAAERHGHPLYEELLRFHHGRLERERKNKRYAFDARRRGIERIGLPAVRQHRLNELAKEETSWNLESQSRAHVHPELVPRLIIRVEGLGDV